MPMRERATIAIPNFATFEEAVPVQSRLIRFGIFENYLEVDFLPSISLVSKSPYDLWSARSQSLERGSIFEIPAFSTQYFFLCHCFAKFECTTGVSASSALTTQNFIAEFQYEVLHFPCTVMTVSLNSRRTLDSVGDPQAFRRCITSGDISSPQRFVDKNQLRDSCSGLFLA